MPIHLCIVSGCFLTTMAASNICDRNHTTHSLKYSLSGPLEKKFAKPTCYLIKEPWEVSTFIIVPIFTDEKPEAQSGKVTCLKPYSSQAQSQNWNAS